MMLEEILSKENMTRAYKRVKSNKGASGPDGMKVEELQEYLQGNWSSLKAKILEGSYKPGPVKGVEIPKSNGKKRELGIPRLYL